MALSISYLIELRDRFSPSIKKAARSLKKFEGDLKKNESQIKRSLAKSKAAFKKFSDSTKISLLGVAKVAKKVFIGIAGVATAALTKTILSGIKYEDALLDLSAITGAAGKDLKFLGDAALLNSKQWGVAAPEIVESFKLIASAKSELLKDPKGLINIGQNALILQKATGLALGDMTSALTESLNKFGEGADQASRFINVLAAGSKIGASEIGDTAEVIKKAGSAAKLAGIDFEELNAITQVIAKQGGLKGLDVGAQLKTALLKLEIEKGVSKKGLIPVLKRLNKEHLNAKQMAKLFGVDAITVGEILLNNADLIENWTKSVTGTNIAQDQARIRMQAFSHTINVLKARINEAFIRTFVHIKPAIEEIAASFTKWMKSLTAEDIKRFAENLKSFAKAVAFVAREVTRAVNATVKMLQLFKEMREMGSGKFFKGVLGLIETDSGRVSRMREGAQKAAEEARARMQSPEKQAILSKILAQNAGNSKIQTSGTIDANINIAAEKGTEITKANSKTTGPIRNRGFNGIPQGAY